MHHIWSNDQSQHDLSCGGVSLSIRDVAKDFNRRESSNNKRVLGERPTLACLLHAMPRGVRGHAPPGNFGKCILSETHFP